jgi:hypothetical protein
MKYKRTPFKWRYVYFKLDTKEHVDKSCLEKNEVNRKLCILQISVGRTL